ncbi:MAG: hypothetical protein ACREML_09390 [Vulcanimicrobiaceae bacterium]
MTLLFESPPNVSGGFQLHLRILGLELLEARQVAGVRIICRLASGSKVRV